MGGVPKEMIFYKPPEVAGELGEPDSICFEGHDFERDITPQQIAETLAPGRKIEHVYIKVGLEDKLIPLLELITQGGINWLMLSDQDDGVSSELRLEISAFD